jgi:hypothetical protein
MWIGVAKLAGRMGGKFTLWAGRAFPRVVRLSGTMIGSALGTIWKSRSAKMTRYIMVAFSGARYSKAAGLAKSTWSKLPRWARIGTRFTSEFVAFWILSDLIIKDGPNNEPQVYMNEDGELVLMDPGELVDLIMLANGHSRLLESFGLSGTGSQMRNGVIGGGLDLANDIMRSKAVISGAYVDDQFVGRLRAIGERERIFIISRLINTAKVIGQFSDIPTVMQLVTRQAALSDMINSAPTNACERVLEMARMNPTQFESAAAELSILIGSSYDTVANAAFQDYFSAFTTKFDFFDVFSDSNLDEAADIPTLQRALLAKMMSDDSVGVELGWLDRFSVDSDGEDDESAAVENLVRFSMVSHRYADLVDALLADNDSLVRDLLNR